jgi:hypothetical protein
MCTQGHLVYYILSVVMSAFIVQNLVYKLYLLVLLYMNVLYGFRVIYIEWACWKKVIFTYFHSVCYSFHTVNIF